MDVRSELSSATQKQIVKEAAFHRNFPIGARGKIDNHFAPIDRDERDRTKFRMRQIPHPMREFESLQHRPRRWIQTVAAYFLAWKFFPLEHDRPQAGQRAK